MKSGADRVAELVARRADIGELPTVADMAQREACRDDLPLFLRTYMPAVFSRPFGEAALHYLADLVNCMKNGGKKAVAMPRGYGKTAMAIGATIWAALYAHRRYIVLVSATADASAQMIKDISAHLTGEEIAADFPEVAYPIECLDGKAQRCKSQTYQGEPTRIEMLRDSIVFPSVGGNENAGVTIQAASLTGAVRGKHRTDAEKKWIRPDFVLLDDPQTRESANSETQTNAREAIILGDVLGLAGHDKQIAAVMACTVITFGDLSERFLDPKKHPEWRGQRERMVLSWGSEDIYEEYDEAWRLEEAGAQPIGYASEIWRRLELDAKTGGKVFDDALYGENEVSALQHARNKYLEMGEAQFLAECQNDPPDLRPTAAYSVEAYQVKSQLNYLDRGKPPENCNILVASIDINRYAAAWTVTAYTADRDYKVVDYGFYLPPGKKQLWEGNENASTAVVAAALGAARSILRNPLYGEDVDGLAIDSGFETEAVYSAVQTLAAEFKHRRIVAAKGYPGDHYNDPPKAIAIRRGVLSDIRRTPKCPRGLMSFDSHHWHMEAQKGFLYPVGTEGAVSLFGREAEKHGIFAEQVAAEKLVKTWLNPYGKTVAEWAINGRNEQGDTLAMCLALISCEDSGSGAPSLRRKSKPVETIKPQTAAGQGVQAASPAVWRPRRGHNWAAAW